MLHCCVASTLNLMLCMHFWLRPNVACVCSQLLQIANILFKVCPTCELLKRQQSKHLVRCFEIPRVMQIHKAANLEQTLKTFDSFDEFAADVIQSTSNLLDAFDSGTPNRAPAPVEWLVDTRRAKATMPETSILLCLSKK